MRVVSVRAGVGLALGVAEGRPALLRAPGDGDCSGGGMVSKARRCARAAPRVRSAIGWVFTLLSASAATIVGAMRILVVDDEPAVREALGRVLRLEGFEVAMARDGREAVRSQAAAPADAVLLDVLMPGLDGLEVCRRMRDTGDRAPVLMLTARDELGDRVAGLEAGADDYLPKPFALEELLARLRALLRRSGWTGQRDALRFGDLELDPHAHEVRRGGRLIELTRTEFLLLELFMHHPRQVLTRAQIFDNVWGYDFGPASNSLEVYVGYLRRKTEAAGEPRLLHTVRGVGYVLRAPRP
jgi:two-component system, OmpR family, response regulator MprA